MGNERRDGCGQKGTAEERRHPVRYKKVRMMLKIRVTS